MKWGTICPEHVEECSPRIRIALKGGRHPATGRYLSRKRENLAFLHLAKRIAASKSAHDLCEQIGTETNCSKQAKSKSIHLADVNQLSAISNISYYTEW